MHAAGRGFSIDPVIREGQPWENHRDTERLVLLLGDLHQLEPLSEPWKQHLLDGVNRLIPVRLALFSVMDDFRAASKPRPVDGAIRGDLTAEATAALGEWFARDDIADTHPLFGALMEIRKPLFTHRRVELVEDDDWYRSEVVTNYFKLFGVEDNLSSLCRVNGASRVHGFGLHREIGDTPFSKRDRVLLHLLHRGLQATYEQYEMRRVERQQLPPRLREVLALLRLGLSEKQAALELGISRHTCHDHVKRLYTHFGVRNRASLLDVTNHLFDTNGDVPAT